MKPGIVPTPGGSRRVDDQFSERTAPGLLPARRLITQTLKQEKIAEALSPSHLRPSSVVYQATEDGLGNDLFCQSIETPTGYWDHIILPISVLKGNLPCVSLSASVNILLSQGLVFPNCFAYGINPATTASG
jgi:hypothetical protein